MVEIRELNGIDEMVAQIHVIKELYPEITKEEYHENLSEMIPHNYGQVAAFVDGKCIGLSGYWISAKLWCKRQLEIDNLVVCESHRSHGIGKLLFDYLNKKSKEKDCSTIVLDSYTANFKAHKFFYNEGFGPKGFHFVKVLDKSSIR